MKTMHCQTYHTTMRPEACVIRQENANGDRLSAPGYGDINCKDCDQGRAVAAATDPEAVRDYKAGLKGVRDRSWHRKLAGKKEQRMTTAKTKVCRRKACRHGGNPQPIENFNKNKARPDGLQDYCKECVRDYHQNRKNEAIPDPAGAAAHAERQAAPAPATAGAADPLAALFADQPGLLDKLNRLAAGQYRTPVQQLFYLVDCGYRAANKEGDHAIVQ